VITNKRSVSLAILTLLLFAKTGLPQTALSPNWEELTGPDFIQAIHQSQGVCILPFGIIEKHGPHLPLGTDLLDVRFAVSNAVKQEYAVVFPQYYFGQIFEAQQQPGTVAYSLATQLTLLQETVKEMARNGCKKVVIVNGHGGNDSLLPLFAQAQLATPRDYVVYVFGLPHMNVPGRPALKSKVDMHAGETETSNMLVARPDLVHMDRANQESGADQKTPLTPRWRLHRNLVVCPLPQSLFRRGRRRQQGAGRIRPERVVPPDRRSHQGHQSRPGKPQATKPVLRRLSAPARHQTVIQTRTTSQLAEKVVLLKRHAFGDAINGAESMRLQPLRELFIPSKRASPRSSLSASSLRRP